jgi:hypothetical protein
MDTARLSCLCCGILSGANYTGLFDTACVALGGLGIVFHYFLLNMFMDYHFSEQKDLCILVIFSIPLACMLFFI